MVVRDGQTEILAEPFQKLLVGCLVDPFAFFTEDIFTGAAAGSPELIKQLSAARGQGEVSAAVWMTALVLGIWDFIKTFTFPVPCAEELLAMDMNICFTDVVPVKGTHSAVHVQRNLVIKQGKGQRRTDLEITDTVTVLTSILWSERRTYVRYSDH